MSTPLEPIARIPMKADPFGLTWVHCEFVPGQEAMIIQSVGQPSGVLPWMARNAPSLALGLLVVVTVVWLWVFVRVWRRPRQRGRLYCRRCNYELAPPQVVRTGRRTIRVEDGAKCSECGADLSTRRPVLGRTRLWRAGPLTLVATPVALLSALVFVLMLEPYSGRPAEPWPGSWVLSIAPGMAYQVVPIGPEMVYRFDRVELSAGGRHRRLAEIAALPIDPNVHVSPDGRWIVTGEDRHGGLATHLARIDSRTGRVERTEALPGSVRSVLGYSGDGKHVLVNVADSASADDEPAASLMAVHLDTLEVTTVATIHSPWVVDLAGARHHPLFQFFMLTWPEGVSEPDWVGVALSSCYSNTAPATPAEGRVVVSRQGVQQEWPFTASHGAWYDIKLTEGGRTLNFDGRLLAGAPTRFSIDIESGSIGTLVGSPPMADHTADGRYVFNTQVPARAELTRVADGEHIATVRILQPDASRWGTVGLPVVSADGRWLVHIGLDATAPTVVGPATLWAPVVYVWDLKSPPDAPK